MDFDTFRRNVCATFRLDLSSYKETQLKRRIGNLMLQRNLTDYADYYQLLRRDEGAFQELMDYFTINVTEFFRDPVKFKLLEEKIVPELLNRRQVLRVWSAACSSGAEPYSAAMILEDLTPGKLHHIEATDIDRTVLELAERGVYSADLLRNVSPARRARYFQEENGQYRLHEQLRKRVAFRYHDLLKDPYKKGFDLIICRNVQIYFTKEAQDRVNKMLSSVLNPGGYLFVGSSETIFNYRELNLEKNSHTFYRKVESGSGRGGCSIGAIR
ncbi:MAG: protein-glutamate O-methyltransferase CheR [Bacillota bacterium]